MTLSPPDCNPGPDKPAFHGISSGDGPSFAGGFTPGGGFPSNEGISPGFSDTESSITSGVASGDFLQRDPVGGSPPPGVMSQHPSAQTLEVRNPAGGYSPPGIFSLDSNARTLEVSAPSFANMGGVSGKGLFPSLAGLDGGAGAGGSLLTPARHGQTSFDSHTGQPPYASPADQPSPGSLTSLAGGEFRTNWNSEGGIGTTDAAKPAWGHDGRLPDDVRYGASAIGNAEPGQGAGTHESDPFGPSAIKFVNSYETTAGEKKEPEYQPHWSTQALFSPGMADASSFGGSQKPITLTSGDKMISSYEAVQGLQGEGGVLLAAAKAGKTATDAGGAQNNAPGGQTPTGQTPTGQPNGSQQPKQTDAERFPMRPDLGDSVKKFESGNRGVGTVSKPDKDDPGKVSYGTYQLNSRNEAGTVSVFLNSPEGSKYAERFKGLKPGSPEFSAQWQKLAVEDPEGLRQAEHAFAYRTHYLPNAQAAAKLGLDMDNPAVQDAIWSGALQFGPQGFSDLLKGIRTNNQNFKSLSTEDQLKTIYWARSEGASPNKWKSRGGRYFGQPGNEQGEFEVIRALNDEHQKRKKQ